MLLRKISRESWYLAALLLSGFLFSIWRLGSLALFDLDEGGYAEIAREMLVLEDWITPRLNYVRLLDKPPLLYWFTALSFKLFGISELSARLPVALSIVGIMALCAILGRRFFGSLAGFLSAMIFAASAGLVVFETGRQLQPDILFTLFLTAVLAALLFGLYDPERPRRYLLMGYVAMALAVMTKGLIGLVFPVLALLGYVLLTGEFGRIRQVLFWPGALVFLLLVLPWHLAAEFRSPGFLKFYLLDVHFLRYFNEGAIASSMTSLSLAGLWAGTALIFYPWTFFIPLVIWEDLPLLRRNGSRSDRIVLWLWLWVFVLLLFFSLGSFRLFYYGLPALPALAVLCGRFWAQAIESRSAPCLSGDDCEGRRTSAGLSKPGAPQNASGWRRSWSELTGAAAGPIGSVRFRMGIPAATTPLLMVAMAILLAGFFPDLWQDSLGRELYGMVDTNLMGYDDGAVTASKVVSLPSWDSLSPLAVSCGWTLSALAGSALLAAVLRRYSMTFVFIILSMLALRYFSQVGTQIFEPCVSTKSLGTTISSTFQPGERIVMDGLYEDVASVTFYSGRKIAMVHGVKKDLAFGSRFPEAAGTFLEEEEFFRLWSSGARVYLLTDYPSNDRPDRDDFYARLRLYHLARSGSMKLFTNHPISSTAANPP
jgi:hypothetical protein